MMWFFAILVVVVMGGIAAVAAGRGAPMAEPEHDRPAVDLPAGGALSADDLRRVRFPLALRGYRMADVDALLDRLAREREVAPADAPDVRGDGHTP
ncbi:DivIVA domain-containing protein [Nocardioides sp. SOB77]|uniref:DivIVA domain-containing protein n=1 Tax=Nocardioides oceani TaxID=3058369 RepID=A0ABT8FDA2_9ACTN|nr:DivIVA domain-containing protein [Nocardioides oceani]MDN4172430.1 DivIVA domain-containing protein [Nocardioides oceani]